MATGTMSSMEQLKIELDDVKRRAVDSAYAAAGYVTDDGERDYDALRARLTELVTAASVTTLSERADKAITKGDLVALAFPSVRLDAFGEADDPDLAEFVADELTKKVWEFVKDDETGQVQQRVGESTPGNVLARTRVGNDRTPAVYVTDDLACIREDLLAPLDSQLTAAGRKAARKLAMLTNRRPEHAKVFDRTLKNATKHALSEGETVLAPALEAAQDDAAE